MCARGRACARGGGSPAPPAPTCCARRVVVRGGRAPTASVHDWPRLPAREGSSQSVSQLVELQTAAGATRVHSTEAARVWLSAEGFAPGVSRAGNATSRCGRGLWAAGRRCDACHAERGIGRRRAGKCAHAGPALHGTGSARAKPHHSELVAPRRCRWIALWSDDMTEVSSGGLWLIAAVSAHPQKCSLPRKSTRRGQLAPSRERWMSSLHAYERARAQGPS